MNRAQPDRAITSWLEKRADRWHRLRQLIETQGDRRNESLDEVRTLAQGFRALARDISLARNVMSGSRLTQQLESLFMDAHEAIYRAPGNLRHQILGLVRKQVPQAVRKMRGTILATVVLFLSSGLAGWLLVTVYPELATLFVSEAMINKVQRGELWTDGLLNVMPSSILSLRLMTNNIVVALFAFALGAFYGLGTLYIIGLNGLMLGGVFAFTAEYHMDDALFTFIVAHGVVELSVICLAGAAGVQLGEALARPGDRSRAEAFRDAVVLGGTLMPVCAVFLVGAGLIEGYISPDPDYPLITRVAVGLGYAVLLWVVLSGKAWSPAGSQEA